MLKIPVEEFLLDSPALGLSAEVLDPLRRIVGRDQKRVLAASRLMRSLEALVVGERRQGGSGSSD